MRLVPEHIDRLVPYKPGKPVAELERELGISGAVKLASNESSLGPSPRVVQALSTILSDVSVYPDGAAFDARSAIARFHGVELAEVVLGNGSNELIDLCIRAFPSSDEHVVFGEPSFVWYQIGCTACNLAYTAVPLREHLHFCADDLLAAITPKTKLLFVTNPNNPTGSYLAADELRRVVAEAPADVVVVLDEAYVEFADADDFSSGMELRHLRERLLVLRTFSKAYGLAGLRVGYGVGPATLIDYLHRLRAPFNVSSLAQRAAIVALADQDHLKDYVRLNASERIRVATALEKMGATVVPSQTNFLLVRGAAGKVTGAALYEALLRMGVIVRPMPPPIADHVRITLGTAEQDDVLLAALAKIWA